MMSQIDTRHTEKDKLFSLYMAEAFPETTKSQIAHTEAVMEKEDVEDVRRRFEEWKDNLK
ncbi:MAG: hypothetical protein FWF94_05180 [Oscillospiraceae bacterium]|nr:hypothetical protein [Oscillospiraceae bacterium]